MIHSAGKVVSATPELNNIEMKRAFLIVCIILSLLISCRSTKQINKVIAPKDSTLNVNDVVKDSALMQLNKDLLEFKKHYIDFNTFSAKIKADVETSKEKLPDLTAVVRIQKDKAIWMSVSATFLNIEVYRVYITPDSVILLNKKDKEVQQFTQTLGSIKKLGLHADKTLDLLIKADENWFTGSLIKLFK